MFFFRVSTVYIYTIYSVKVLKNFSPLSFLSDHLIPIQLEFDLFDFLRKLDHKHFMFMVGTGQCQIYRALVKGFEILLGRYMSTLVTNLCKNGMIFLSCCQKASLIIDLIMS